MKQTLFTRLRNAWSRVRTWYQRRSPEVKAANATAVFVVLAQLIVPAGRLYDDVIAWSTGDDSALTGDDFADFARVAVGAAVTGVAWLLNWWYRRHRPGSVSYAATGWPDSGRVRDHD